MTPTQLSLPDAEAAADEAIAQVEANADTEWMIRARYTLVLVARQHPEFTTDDLWGAGLEKPLEPRAMGALMRWAPLAGVAMATDRTRKSAQVSNHARPVRVWHSLLWKGAER